ncbi:hypothetical protein [Spiroplasma endosymbiont of Atherix ibis]|uniref:hypothetical protein n=1 Tax=Spiroplasma endosymbiont of Atherix ibis TaxID=3066291 RepID=UPI0030D06EFC
MRKKVNKKILFGVFGSLLIGASSIVTPVMVVSKTQKGVLNYSKKFNFSNEKDIKNSFNRANISIETTNNYINSVKNLKKSKLYSSSTSLL